MALCEKILITGFSGAGKSTLLRQLQATSRPGWEHFNDLDQLILKKHGKQHTQLATLIDEVGWDKFRLWERQELEGWLKEEGQGILALGGGALSPLVWELLGKNRKIKFCYLKVPFELAWSRLVNDTREARPMVKKGKSELENIFHEREKIFNQISWILNGEKNVEETAQIFWNHLST